MGQDLLLQYYVNAIPYIRIRVRGAAGQALGVDVVEFGQGQAVGANILALTFAVTVTGGGNLLIVLGDNDILVLADGDSWTSTGDTRSITVGGTAETFDVWVADFADTQVTLLINDGLTVQLATALA